MMMRREKEEQKSGIERSRAERGRRRRKRKKLERTQTKRKGKKRQLTNAYLTVDEIASSVFQCFQVKLGYFDADSIAN